MVTIEHELPRLLSADQLYHPCDPADFEFVTTDELVPVDDEAVCQERATTALRFAVQMPGEGYNLYVLGRPGSGRHGLVGRLLGEHASTHATPDDWCYVNRFDDPQRPRVLRLPAGRGVDLQRDMLQLLEDLRGALNTAFESEAYRTQVAEIESEFDERRREALAGLEASASAEDVGVLRTPQGYMLAPIRDGEVLGKPEFDKLSAAEKSVAQEKIALLSERLGELLAQFPRWQKERRLQVKQLDQEITSTAVSVLIEDLCEDYTDCPSVLEYLDVVRTDVIENARDFRKPDEAAMSLPFLPQSEPERNLSRYEVNLLVDHRETRGAPVVYESNPTYMNLVGRVEHTSRFGALTTDFRMIRSGALHRANHGYLIIDAERLLTEPFAWQGLKRALFGTEVRIESLGQTLGLISTATLEPEPLPLDVKVILIGTRLVYYLLCQYDADFSELFKVAADLEDEVDRNQDTTHLFARMIATLVRKHELRPFTRQAVARVIEHSSRLAQDSEKFSTYSRSIRDLLREADYWALHSDHDSVEVEDVRRALSSQIERVDRVRDRILEEIQRGTIRIETEGSTAAQVNGLSVMQLGDFAFGQPSRITATVRLGQGEIVDIEREVDLGGKVHSKGVLILSSLLGSRYARNRPLSLSASLVFEQTYGGVDGDSASVAELVALLSAVARVPVRQGLAVTGSIDQLGRVQVIGGVNEKIEGFFDVCAARGLTGEQGVLIPQENVKHLMLRHDVVEAVGEGRFGIYAIGTIDDALQLFTGMPAGEPDAAGDYPAGSFNRIVCDHLQQLVDLRRAFAARDSEALDRQRPGAVGEAADV